MSDVSRPRLGIGKSAVLSLLAALIASVISSVIFIIAAEASDHVSTTTATRWDIYILASLLVVLVSLFFLIPLCVVMGPVVDRLLPANWHSLWMSGLIGFAAGAALAVALDLHSFFVGFPLDEIGGGGLYGVTAGVLFAYLRYRHIRRRAKE